MMRIIRLCIYFLCGALLVEAQNLTGTVYDDRQPVAGATIYLLAHKATGTTSDENGRYSLGLPSGSHVLVCSYIGYASDTFAVTMESGVDATHHILLRNAALELRQVVVSAGKYEQRAEDITVSLEVLPVQLIENKNTTQITQALEQVPGLNVLDEEPQIRGGSGFTFGVGSRVAVLIDGIPVLRGDIGKPEWSFIPVENLEQVEVIKGPASVLYESSALSGVINFLSQYPKEPSETKVRLYSGVYSAPANPAAQWWDGIANFSGLNISQGWRTDRFDLILGGQVLYDHGFIGPPVPNPNLGFEQDTIGNDEVSDRSGRLNFDFRYRPSFNDRLSFGMNGNLMRQRSNFSLVWGDDSANIYRAFPATMTLTDNLQFYVDPFITYYTSLGFRHSLKSRYYWFSDETPGVQKTVNRVWYGEYQVSGNFAKIFARDSTGKDLHLTGGVVVDNSYVQDDLYSAGGELENRLHNYAGYVQLDKLFLEKINMSGGFRLEYFDLNGNEAEFRPVFRIGMNTRVSKGTFLRGSFGQGYRYPTIAEKYIQTTVGGLIVFPNPQLKPETSWNTEVGVKQMFKLGGWYGAADAAIFWQQYKQMIEYNYALWAPDSAGFRFVNTGPTRVRGLDLSLSGQGKIGNKITLIVLAGYTYILPQSLEPGYIYAVENPGEGFIPKELSYLSTSSDTTNSILKYRFQHLAKIDAELTFRKKISFGISERYYSFMQNIDKTFYDIDISGVLPTGIAGYRSEHDGGAWVTDVRAGYTFASKYKAGIVINNLFNLEYSLRPVKIESMRTIALQLRADL